MKKFIILASLAGMLGLPAAAAESERFAPIPPNQLTEQQKKFVEAMSAGPRAGNINTPPFKVFVRSPEFAMLAIGMSNYLRWGTGMEARLVEFAILIAARQWTSDYIWHAHHNLAVSAGLDPKIPAAIAAGQRPAGMKEDETLIYEFLTQMYRDREISDATFDAAVKRFGEKGVTDLIGIASYYGITAMAVVAAKQETPVGDEPRLERILQPFTK